MYVSIYLMHTLGLSESMLFFKNRLQKKFVFFLNLFFSAVRNFKFQYDPLSNLKDISDLWGRLFLDIFQRNLAHL
jgi:hypothetical protein